MTDLITTIPAAPEGRDLVNQLIGHAQSRMAMRDFANVMSLSLLKHVKENKLYKWADGQKAVDADGNEIPNVGTWEGFCRTVGVSVAKADEDIANMNAFGEATLTSMQRMGVGYRDLRQFRKLPADERTALIEAAQSGDKDSLMELAEDLLARNAKLRDEKDAIQDKAEQARANLQSRLNTAEARAIALEKGSPRLTAFEPFTEDVRAECMHLQGQAQIAIEGLEQLFQDAVHKSDPMSPEHRLRMEQVWIAAHVVAARASDLLGTFSQVDYGLPDRVKGEHILTPPEADAWIQGWSTLKAEASATRYARAEARAFERASQQPRGRGRPRKNPTAE